MLGAIRGLHERKHERSQWRQKVFGLLVGFAVCYQEIFVVPWETAVIAQSSHGGRWQCGVPCLMAAVFA